MSAVATLQFDPSFNMGSRSSYGWPVLESNSNGGLLGHDLGPYTSDASLTPPSGSRSVTASPPRASMTPEQRELKRQQDHARREMKQRERVRRGTGPYVQSPPSTMADLASPNGLPVYTTGPTQISLLTEPATTLAPSPNPGPYMTSYSPQLSAEPNPMFPPTPYSQQPYLTEYTPYPASSAPSLPSHYGRPPMPQQHEQMYPMPVMPGQGPGPHEGPNGTVRVVQSRPKPQCWEHGCNGRQFSTFSNLLRHQREKSGQAAKAVCPICGAEFTRTTARNGHMQHEKCKPRRGS